MIQTTPKQKKLLFPLSLIGVFALGLVVIWVAKPEASRRAPPPASKIQIAVQTLEPQNFQVVIGSYGLVKPLTRSTLVAQVNGIVEFVDESFREGGRFRKGQVLLRLDKSDYHIELKVAQGQVAEAESRYTNELALAAEARASWKSSGRSQTPPPLAVREPQVAAAKAALQSSQASAQRAELNLARTEILAPYDGQVLEQLVDVGQLVTTNSPVAQVFASDAAEINLPVKSGDLNLLQLSGLNNTEKLGDTEGSMHSGPDVIFHSSLGKRSIWHGHVVRVASGINPESRQLQLIARIPQPFEASADGRDALKVNEYLKADIQGRTLGDVIVIPNSAIYQNSYVYVYANEEVRRRDVSVTWSNTRNSIIESGLSAGEQLVLTALGQVPSGTPARIIGSAQENDEAINKRRGAAREGEKPEMNTKTSRSNAES